MESKNNKSFINVTGLTYNAFKTLSNAFGSFWGCQNHSKAGRKRNLIYEDVLGLLLHYLNSTMGQKTLAEIFGIVPSTVSTTIQQGLPCLIQALESFEYALVRWPDATEMQELSERVARREPLLQNTIGFVDGLNLPVLQHQDPQIQNAFYNGWLAGCFVSNVFVFSSKGYIIYGAINRPGSWHDAQVSRKLIDKLSKSNHDYNILADSAFPVSKRVQGKILVVLKEDAKERLGNSLNRLEYTRALKIDRAIISQRQAAEWGMGTFQKTFGRLKLPLPTDEGKRKHMLLACIYLHNYRCKTVGINQIKTVFG
jgi:hypothetical protein